MDEQMSLLIKCAHRATNVLLARSEPVLYACARLAREARATCCSATHRRADVCRRTSTRGCQIARLRCENEIARAVVLSASSLCCAADAAWVCTPSRGDTLCGDHARRSTLTYARRESSTLKLDSFFAVNKKRVRVPPEHRQNR